MGRRNKQQQNWGKRNANRQWRRENKGKLIDFSVDINVVELTKQYKNEKKPLLIPHGHIFNGDYGVKVKCLQQHVVKPKLWWRLVAWWSKNPWRKFRVKGVVV